MAKAGWRARLFPADATKYEGPSAVVAALAVLDCAGAARSVVHLVASDSGARSVAGLPLGGGGGDNVVALLAQWGGAQSLEALAIAAVVARYRGLVPLALLGLTLEQALRIGIGRAKPFRASHTPPGSIGSRALLPVCALLFAASLVGPRVVGSLAPHAVGRMAS
jgi:hypothetical protein